MNNDLLESALRYTQRGWQVFPLHNLQKNGTCSCGTNCELRRMSPGKHPRTTHGFLDATVDHDRIVEWWSRWPDANIGVSTGQTSDLWVLDVDNGRSVELGGGLLVPEGKHSLQVLENEFGPLPGTLTSFTGSGGSHYLFRYPTNGAEYRNRNHFRPGLDVRASGGYIVAAPSNHASGHSYRWIDEEAPIAEAPAWLISLAANAPKESRAVLEPGERIAVGGRNRKLFELGSFYRGVHGFEFPQIFALLMGHNMNDTEEPLDRGEIEQIARNAATLSVNTPDATWVQSGVGTIENTGPEIDPGSDLAFSLSQLMSRDIDPPIPIVHGLIDSGSGIILAGPPNVGKSWFALDLAVAVATGGKFLDEFETTQGPVLIIDEEGTEWGDQNRFDMLLAGRGITSAVGIPIYLAIGKGYKLDTEKGLAAIRRMIERYSPSLVIIDSMIRVHSGDENASREMSDFLAITTRLMQTTGASFLFVHHVRKPKIDDRGGDPGDLIRGSSDIRAWPSTGFVMLPKNGGLVEVYNIKQRWRQVHQTFDLRIQVSSDGDTATLGYMGKVEKKLTSAIDVRNMITRIVSEINYEGTEATSSLIVFRSGKQRRTVEDHLKALVAGGVLRTAPSTRIGYMKGPTPLVYIPSE